MAADHPEPAVADPAEDERHRRLIAKYRAAEGFLARRWTAASRPAWALTEFGPGSEGIRGRTESPYEPSGLGRLLGAFSLLLRVVALVPTGRLGLGRSGLGSFSRYLGVLALIARRLGRFVHALSSRRAGHLLIPALRPHSCTHLPRWEGFW